MIKRIFSKESKLLFIGCKLDRVLGCKITTLYSCYGDDERYAYYWVQLDNSKNVVAAFSFFAGLMTICIDKNSTKEDIDELFAFTSFTENISIECTDNKLFEKKFIDEKSENTKNITNIYSLSLMKNTSLQKTSSDITVEKHINLTEVCDLLGQVHQEFEQNVNYSDWYYNACVRRKKHYAHIYGVFENEKCLSSAGVYDSNNEIALISNVVTSPLHRKKGFCTALIIELLQDMAKKGLVVYIIPIDRCAENFYEKLGFITIGSILCIGDSNV